MRTTPETADGLAAAVEYSRRLYADVLEWYHSADTKAQVAIGIDGAFLAFLAGACFQKPDDLKRVIDTFSIWTWVLLTLMVATLVASILAAVYCLWSRMYFASTLGTWLKDAKDRSRPGEYPPEVMWFFQHVAALDDEKFRLTLANVDAQFELDAMGSQISKLSQNVRTKHLAVDLGFVLATLTLILFGLAAVSYVAHARGWTAA